MTQTTETSVTTLSGMATEEEMTQTTETSVTTLLGVVVERQFFKKFNLLTIMEENNDGKDDDTEKLLLLDAGDDHDTGNTKKTIKLGDLVQATGESQQAAFGNWKMWFRVLKIEILAMRYCSQESINARRSTYPKTKKKKKKNKGQKRTGINGNEHGKGGNEHSLLRGKILADFIIEEIGGSEHLMRGNGVLDVAGGAGHLSLAFALRGIDSTVVDPRDKVGQIPKRDRKLLRKCNSPGAMNTIRAFFGKPLEGSDVCFGGGGDNIDSFTPDGSHEFSAIVGLHPDEATDAIVDFAVSKTLPFAVVPCCVFSRLFPERSPAVSTRDELIEYLCSKHPSIRRATLPFDGANVVVFATTYDDIL